MLSVRSELVMRRASRSKWWWSIAIVVLGIAAGFATVAMRAFPQRLVWLDTEVPSLLVRISTFTDRVVNRFSASLSERAISTPTPPLVPLPAAPVAPVPAEPERQASDALTPTSAVAPVIEPSIEPTVEAEPERLAAGVIRSKEQATLASRMTALITRMPLQVGQVFKQGDTLIAFDCSQMYAQLKAADAAVEAYKTTYETNVELDQYKAIGINEVRVSRANVNKAAAEADALRATTSQCQIDAPFDGSVVERKANPYDIAASGQPLMMIQSNGRLEVELIVPSAWLLWLEPGNRFNFHLEETGQTVQGKVTRLGATVDPVSKTIRIVGEIESQSRTLPGMSGMAHFDASDPVPTAGGSNVKRS
ncbi:efflux RND transporter periplasmic adaptor subunit [Pseudomonas sp. ITA]|uniref:efflux RND transporter periplasmic adaptor subunit n=1 Tax=Pseudomonas sp. ITA TaxID=2825841 RepID=UPI00249A9A55|nr:efflux RND transporter periplasmic adaptor subunit [Pseudomonas sp. ITA]